MGGYKIKKSIRLGSEKFDFGGRVVLVGAGVALLGSHTILKEI